MKKMNGLLNIYSGIDGLNNSDYCNEVKSWEAKLNISPSEFKLQPHDDIGGNVTVNTLVCNASSKLHHIKNNGEVSRSTVTPIDVLLAVILQAKQLKKDRKRKMLDIQSDAAHILLAGVLQARRLFMQEAEKLSRSSFAEENENEKQRLKDESGIKANLGATLSKLASEIKPYEADIVRTKKTLYRGIKNIIDDYGNIDL